MPCLDKPLEELKVYNGMSPCPKDIDEFWNSSLEEMRNIDSNVEYIKPEFHAPGVECYDMYFTGVNSARIHVKHIRPSNISGKLPAVLCFHGYSGSAGDWMEYLAYAQSGFAVYALDVRGQAGQSEDVGGVKGNTLHGQIIRGLIEADPKKLLFRDIFLDTAQLAKIVMDTDFIDETRVGAFGGSQGGGLTYACCSLEPRINRAFAYYPFLSDYKRVWNMDMDKAAYSELREFFRFFDPRHEREDEIFNVLGYIDIQNISKRIKAKLTMFTGLRDEICPPSTQFAAYNKITSEKNFIIYPDYGHEHFPDVADIVFSGFLEM